MGEETLVSEVSESKAAGAAVVPTHLKSGYSLAEKMEAESNGAEDVRGDGKDLKTEKTDEGQAVKEDEDGRDGKGEEEPQAEAAEVDAAGEKNGEGAVREKECEQKSEKDVDVTRAKDEKVVEREEKTGEKVEESEEIKEEEQPIEGSIEENDVEEVGGVKEEKDAEEIEENKEVKDVEKVDETKVEVKDPDEFEGSQEEKNADEVEEGEEEKEEEISGENQEKEHDEGKLSNNKEKKVSRKRSRRKSAGGRRERKKKEGESGEEEETAEKKKGTETKKNKKEEKKEEKDEKELERTPIMDRPVRERKSVERLVSIIEKDANKEFKIEKGPGTPLKDIPNVASQLRRRNDETLKLLHSLLFGRRCKAFEIRGHISRFSGFVWHDNEVIFADKKGIRRGKQFAHKKAIEIDAVTDRKHFRKESEKQKNKVKEKFDKCTKEKLLEICDVLDIQVSRASVKKEELVTKLIDFLVAPYASTTVVLTEEPSKGQKRKRVVKQNSSARQSVKSRKKNEDSSKRKGSGPLSDSENASEEDEEDEPDDEERTENGIPEKSDDEMADQSESEEKDVSEESKDETRKHKNKARSSGKKDSSSGKTRNKKAATVPKKPSSSQSKAVNDGDRRVSSKKNEKGIKKARTPAKFSGKRDAKGKGKSKDVKPSDEELRNAICEILKEVDFNTATFTDILKQLAKQFDMDLTSKKSSIKLMIQEELTKLADEADDDEEDDEGEPEKERADAAKDEAPAAADGTEVKA